MKKPFYKSKAPPWRVVSSARINLFGLSLQEEMKYVRHEEKDHTTKQGRRNVTQSEGGSETSISSRVKTNPLQWISTLICIFLVRPGESFSI